MEQNNISSITRPGSDRKAVSDPLDRHHDDFVNGRLLVPTMSALAMSRPEWLDEIAEPDREAIRTYRSAERFVRNPSDRPPPVRPLDWSKLATREPPARQWYVAHWLAPGVTLLAGRGGIGKSLLSQQIGTALAAGAAFIDTIPTPQTVLAWMAEDDEIELWRRQIGICNYFDIAMPALAGRLIIMPRRGQENTLYATAYGAPAWTPAIGELEEQIADYKADVVILDNIAQLYGADENNRHCVTDFVNGLIGIAHGRPVAFLLLAHPARGRGSEFSGSSAWENAVRMRWYLGDRLPDEREDDDDEPADGVRFLCKRKSNYSNLDYRRLTYQSGVFAPDTVDTPSGDGLTAHLRKERARRVVLTAIRQLAERGIHTSEKSGRNFAPTVIAAYKLNEDLTKRELGDAMRELLLAGKISREVVGRYSNRSEMYGLRATS